MRERFFKEVNHYVKLNNEKWGVICGAVLGSIVGVYVEKNYVAPKEIEDLFIKLLLLGSTVPATAGLFSVLFSNTGKFLDVVFHNTTILNWLAQKISYCRDSILDARDEELFFTEGLRYNRRTPTEDGALILRHVDSELSDVRGSSNEPSPRAVMKTAGYQSASSYIEVTLSRSNSSAEEDRSPVNSKGVSERSKRKCCC